MPNFPAFVSYVLLTTFTPGPNNIMAMSYASKFGFKKSLPLFFGIITGFVIVFAISNFFSVTLYSIIPTIKPVMTVIGASYILWLAYKILRSKPGHDAHEEKHANNFITGMLLQFVNPKLILYSITTASTFIVPYYTGFFFLVLFTIVLGFLGLMSIFSWAAFGALFQKFFFGHSTLINTVMALLLVYTAYSLF
ncbi:MAG TPA: lysine transporter LysE [Clostridiales bacterium UBA8960]|nr:lysine transporter LysE [Clostridiales bacterium UBA8960]